MWNLTNLFANNPIQDIRIGMSDFAKIGAEVLLIHLTDTIVSFQMLRLYLHKHLIFSWFHCTWPCHSVALTWSDQTDSTVNFYMLIPASLPAMLVSIYSTLTYAWFRWGSGRMQAKNVADKTWPRPLPPDHNHKSSKERLRKKLWTAHAYLHTYTQCIGPQGMTDHECFASHYQLWLTFQ